MDSARRSLLLTLALTGALLVGAAPAQGWDLSVNAPDQGRNVFSSWSDGGARSHTIRTPAAARTYTATFKKSRR